MFAERVWDSDLVQAVFDDHRETIEVGSWTELVIGNVRLLREPDGRIVVERIEECVLL